MSEELEQIFDSMLNGKIPAKWAKSSYPSLKSLGGYVKDLSGRIKFLNTWIANGKPASYWLSGFYFTQAFLTGVRQNYARANGIAIDLLVFAYEVTKIESQDNPSIIEPAPGGAVFVYGLFMEGFMWDRDAMQLGESIPKQLYDELPVLKLVPIKKNDLKLPPCYGAPVYKTTERKGVLATTGHSSNYVMQIDLPTDKLEAHWINRGAVTTNK